MPDLLIKDVELSQLDRIVGQIPTLYGMPIVKFFEALQQRRQAEASMAKQSNGIKTQPGSETVTGELTSNKAASDKRQFKDNSANGESGSLDVKEASAQS